LHSPEFKEASRFHKTHFTRQRILSFTVLIGFLLNMLTKTLQIELERFLRVLKGEATDATVSKQAFSKARKKLSEQVFIRLNTHLLTEFYQDNTYHTWKGYRLLGIDGSTLQLPTYPEVVQEFGEVTNQHGSIMAMGKFSVMYDLLNDLSLDTILERYTSEERELALRHLDRLADLDQQTEGRRGHQGDLLVFDMGYPALYFIVLLALQGRDFVIRSSGAFLKEIQEVVQAALPDVVIPIALAKPGRPLPLQLKERVPSIRPQMPFTIRVLTLRLEDGTQEILLTTLRDQAQFPYTDFQALYHKRWGSETHYDVLKNGLEIENFTGKSALSVKQDVYATVLTNNIRGLIQGELAEEVAAERAAKLPETKYHYGLNTHLAIGRLKDDLVTLLLGQGDLEAFYRRLKQRMQRSLVPLRPGRQFPRKRKNHQKYTMTKRRAL
jgi:Transposase DDE domain